MWGRGGLGTPDDRTPSGARGSAVTPAEAAAYARAVNLQPRDVPGFSGPGGEVESPPPGPYAFAFARCTGAPSPSGRIARISSPEFSAGRRFNSRLMKSSVEVWLTATAVALSTARSRSPRSHACTVRNIEGTRRKINRENRGGIQGGPFTVTYMPKPLPAEATSFHTRINETRLHRNGSVFFHVYRDLLGFSSGAAEVELEAVGFVHPLAAQTQRRALQTLLERAISSSRELRP